MKYGSVCSGIEAASVAWKPLGWQPQFFSEIEAFPCAVLAHHYGSSLPGKPVGNGVPNHGDMTKFKDWPDHAIDLLVGGTPCQSFSVAGLRAGLADPRGNLMLTYLAVTAKYQPRWLLWENVPGVLSSAGGRDFGSFLGGLGELGYGFAYRVLDAQFCRALGCAGAVPQRRRRVFVVGHFGDWRRAAAVLFDGASLRGDPAPCREAGQEIAGTVNAGAHPGSDNGQDAYNDLLVAHALRADGFDASEDGTGRVPVVAASLTRGAESAGKGGYAGRRQEDDLNIIAAGAHPPAIAFDAYNQSVSDVSHPLRCGSGDDIPQVFQPGWGVRRLTPVECLRLQGFPDDYFDNVIYRGKKPADGPIYKALGNSMAVNVMRVIGSRIAMVDVDAEQARSAA